MKFDLLLQIGPSGLGRRAQRPAKRRPRGCALALTLSRRPYVFQAFHPKPDRTSRHAPRSRHRHLALRAHAAFLDDGLQPAATELSFPEPADGYAQFRQRLELLAARHPAASFSIRLDVAGQYADNLLAFLHNLAAPQPPGPLAGRDITISCGDPQRNKNYRAALFGSKYSSGVNSRTRGAASSRRW